MKRATSSMEFSHFEEVPANIAKEVIEKASGKRKGGTVACPGGEQGVRIKGITISTYMRFGERFIAEIKKHVES